MAPVHSRLQESGVKGKLNMVGLNPSYQGLPRTLAWIGNDTSWTSPAVKTPMQGNGEINPGWGTKMQHAAEYGQILKQKQRNRKGHSYSRHCFLLPGKM